jgi:predicted CoA-binding protein
MAKIDDLVHDFLAQKVIAVVDVSDKRETGANRNYKTFKQRGYRVYAVNPRISTFDGARCYPDLKSIPEKPDAVFMLTSPKVTEQIVQQCVDLGIEHVWMHCLMGTKSGLSAGSSSVSASALEVCRANGIVVIPGSCPAQFLEADFGHSMMRRLWSLLGYLNMNGGTQ